MLILFAIGILNFCSVEASWNRLPTPSPRVQDVGGNVEEEKNKTIVYAHCPISCRCNHTEEGSIQYAFCEDSDPLYIFLNAERIQHLSIERCSGRLENHTVSTQSVGTVETLRLVGCEIEPETVSNYSVFFALAKLEIINSSAELIQIDCRVVVNLALINLAGNKLTHNPIDNCSAPFLRSLNLSDNSLTEFRLQSIETYGELIHLDLGGNELETVEPSEKRLYLTKLVLRDNPQLRSLCSQVFHALPNLEDLGTYKDVAVYLSFLYSNMSMVVNYKGIG